jgi:hypothetical protein
MDLSFESQELNVKLSTSTTGTKTLCMSNTTTLRHTRTCLEILHQMITKPLKHRWVFNLIMHTQELTRQKLIVSLILLHHHLDHSQSLLPCPRSFSMDMLCKIITPVMMYRMVSLSQVIQGPPTMANLDWRSPNALLTSFLTASCARVKWSFLLLCWFR